MKLRVKSNGLEVDIKKENYQKLSDEQKLAYDIISIEDKIPVKDQAVKNEVKAPETGQKSK